MKKRLLVVAAHPDDEVLGCGGTIAKWVREGAHADLLILGEGLAARGPQTQQKFDALKNQCRKASRLTGYQSVSFENFPDNEFDTVSLLSLIQCVEKHLRILKPNIVFTHHPGDLNIDHRLCAEAVLTGSRPIHNAVFPKTIYSFEVLSVTEWRAHSPEQVFVPNVYVDISRTIATKKRALQTYRGEVRPYPHPRSLPGIEYLARRRGLEAGLRLAEAFRVLRHVES